MARTGRPPKSARLRILQGNLGKRPIPDELQPEGEPSKPRGMPPVAARMWDDVVPQLIALKLATRLDTTYLEEMCRWFARYVRLRNAADRPKAKDSTLRLALAAWARFDAIASRFGLSPADRNRLRGGLVPLADDDKQRKRAKFLR